MGATARPAALIHIINGLQRSDPQTSEYVQDFSSLYIKIGHPTVSSIEFENRRPASPVFDDQ